jgi:quinol-cytochrome oxidoreductase complex cytochrome b subunit
MNGKLYTTAIRVIRSNDMSANVTAIANVSVRKCSFCAEEILSDAKKCKHCGEFVNRTVSKGVLAMFAAGLVVACILAGMQPAPSEGVLAVGVWAIFAVLFARMFARG